ncbi:MAG: hypothetical protein A2Y38_09710 [Spirochaetes bacterium GWB1_59_5]|nr:MAG: hypothetical protein A2Y38_09710 [Spirochaetes bacterium GWB1_59_5]
MKTARLLAACMLMVIASSSVWPQAATTSSSTAPALSALPEPYTKDEFPSWAVDLRRFEIVSLGAFPILLFYTRFGFDLKRYVQHGFSAEYAPWPLKSETSYVASDDEQILSVATAVGLSLAFGAIDAFFLWKKTLD